MALLPPSSRCTRFRCLAPSSPTARPALVDPVKEITRTAGSVTRALPTSAPPGSTWKRPSGRPASRENGRQHESAGDRGARVGLEDDGVAERQRRRHRSAGKDLREVERRNHADHSDRHATGQAQPGLAAAQQLSVRCHGDSGGREEHAGHQVRFKAGLALGGSGLAHEPIAEHIGVLLDERPGPAQHARPLLIGCCGPGFLRRDRGVRGAS